MDWCLIKRRIYGYIFMAWCLIKHRIHLTARCLIKHMIHLHAWYLIQSAGTNLPLPLHVVFIEFLIRLG